MLAKYSVRIFIRDLSSIFCYLTNDDNSQDNYDVNCMVPSCRDPSGGSSKIEGHLTVVLNTPWGSLFGLFFYFYLEFSSTILDYLIMFFFYMQLLHISCILTNIFPGAKKSCLRCDCGPH